MVDPSQHLNQNTSVSGTPADAYKTQEGGFLGGHRISDSSNDQNLGKTATVKNTMSLSVKNF